VEKTKIAWRDRGAPRDSFDHPIPDYADVLFHLDNGDRVRVCLTDDANGIRVNVFNGDANVRPVSANLIEVRP